MARHPLPLNGTPPIRHFFWTLYWPFYIVIIIILYCSLLHPCFIPGCGHYYYSLLHGAHGYHYSRHLQILTLPGPGAVVYIVNPMYIIMY